MKFLIKIYGDSFSGLSGSVWALSLVALINRSGSMVLFFMTLYLTTQKEYTITEAGQIISIYGLGSLLGSYLGGWLSDKIGSFKVQFLSLILCGIGYIFLGYIDSHHGIAIMMFIVAAVGDALRPANNSAIAAAALPENRARSYALNRLAINLGMTIGPAVGGILADINYIYLFWADGITCILAGIVLLLFGKKLRTLDVKSIKENVNKIVSPWRDKIFLALLFLLLVIGIVFCQVFNIWPLYLKEHYSLNEDNIGLLLGLNALVIVLAEMPLVHRVEKMKSLKVMGIGALLVLGGFSILPFSQTFLFAAATVLIWTTGEMLVFPLVTGFIANRASDSNRGKYMGITTLTFSLSFVIGPALGTLAYEKLGPDQLWMIVGLLALLVYYGFLLLQNKL